MKLVEVNEAKAFASTFFGDPILKMAVNAAMDNAPGFELVRCKECAKRIYCDDERLYWCAECHYRCNNGEWHCADGERKDA